MSTEVAVVVLLEPDHFLVVAIVDVGYFGMDVFVVDHFDAVLSVKSQLVVDELLEEAVVGFDEGPFAFDVIESFEQSHLLVFHQVGQAEAC